MNLKGKLLVEHNENKTQNRFEILLKFVVFFYFQTPHIAHLSPLAHTSKVFLEKKNLQPHLMLLWH